MIKTLAHYEITSQLDPRSIFFYRRFRLLAGSALLILDK